MVPVTTMESSSVKESKTDSAAAVGAAPPSRGTGRLDARTLIAKPLGVFSGVDYVQYEAMFEGTTGSGHPYRVPCRIIAPAVRERRSGVVVFDWLNNALIAAGLQAPLARSFLKDDLLFGRGHVYATVRSAPEALGAPWLLSGFDETGQPVFSGFDTTGESIAVASDEFDIVAAFVPALTQDPVASEVVGAVEHRVSFGYSDSGFKMRGFVRDPLGAGVFDLSISGGVGASTAFRAGPVLESRLDPAPPPAAGGLEMGINAENELFRGDELQLLRRDAPNSRSYEFAGAAHSPAVPELLATYSLLHTPDVESINPLDWTPFARALFGAGLDWTHGVEPPPSIWLGAPNDPTIARDANENALIRFVGGRPVNTPFYRHPEVAVGLGRYLAVFRSPDHLRSLAGEFIDLSHTFTSHEAFVAAISEHATFMRDARYLLPADAAAIIQRAQESTVGNHH